MTTVRSPRTSRPRHRPAWAAAAIAVAGALALGGAAAPADATAAPKVSSVSAAYAGSGLYGTVRFCDAAVEARTAFRIVWRAYRVEDGSLWRTSRTRVATARKCATAGVSFFGAPQKEYHRLRVTVINLATGAIGRGQSRVGTVA